MRETDCSYNLISTISTIAPSTSPEGRGIGPEATRYCLTEAEEASSSQKGLVQDLAGQQDPLWAV